MYYILKDNQPIPCDMETWAKSRHGGAWVLYHSWHYGILTSTIFLGIDCGFIPGGPPILFETMIFGGKHSDYQKRYAAYDDAMAGHWAAFSKVIASAHIWDGAIYRVRVWRQRKKLHKAVRIFLKEDGQWKKTRLIVTNAFTAAAYRAIRILRATISRLTQRDRSME